MTEVVRRRARIEGRVQGVWFRGSTREQAIRHGVAGSVRNLPGGDVEAVFEGPRDAVDALLAFVREGRDGLPGAPWIGSGLKQTHFRPPSPGAIG